MLKFPGPIRHPRGDVHQVSDDGSESGKASRLEILIWIISAQRCYLKP